MKRQYLVMVLSVIFAVSMITSCAKSEKTLTTTELLDLGEKYLLELNYEQAVVQFTKLIEIEPKNPRGYTGLAEAYIGLGNIDKAIEVLRQGLEQLPDSEELKTILDNILPMQNLRLIDSQYDDICVNALSLLNSNNVEELVSYLREYLVRPLREEALDVSDSYILYYGDVIEGLPQGVGIYIYSKGIKETTEAYIGEFNKGLCTGTGVALFANAHNQGYYVGGWKGDSPNGDGAMYNDLFGYGNYSDIPDGIYDYYSIGTTNMGVAEGYWLEGRYENGEIPLEDGIEEGGTVIAGYQYYCIDGKASPMGKVSDSAWWFGYQGYGTETDAGDLMAKAYIVYEDGTEVYQEAPHEHAGVPCSICEGGESLGFHAWKELRDDQVQQRYGFYLW